jgi:hypothetical protein
MLRTFNLYLLKKMVANIERFKNKTIVEAILCQVDHLLLKIIVRVILYKLKVVRVRNHRLLIFKLLSNNNKI